MAKVIMVQGTTSNAGKSLITAGLCRVFMQDGYKVAPFKSQNMALNSYITKDGLEMGRAQVMQAEASGIEPDVRMNPILLKPTGDMGSQVIINGEVCGNMSARDYHKNKGKYADVVLKAYNELASQYDIIVIEGAGSPAEINLKQNDIVNMGMAKMAKAPVVIVADIDRGGVFASLAGTVMLLDDEEKSMVKGLVINKFRGDLDILKPGLDMIYDITNKKVLGVVPYMHVDIDDEDSLSERLSDDKIPDLVDIAVIRTPRISNFTDFNVFERIPGVSLRYVKSISELKNPDMVIIPGSKNTMDDLLWIRQNGLEAAVLKLADAGKIIFGICGGYQMLGEKLCDLFGVEHGGEMKGMCLLPCETIFEQEKVRTRVEGKVEEVTGALDTLVGANFVGYEIHMGKTKAIGDAGSFCIISEENKSQPHSDGYYKNNVYGTYVHGFFDSDEVSTAIVNTILKSKGIEPENVLAYDNEVYKTKQYDILAQNIRDSLDMKEIYEILDRGV